MKNRLLQGWGVTRIIRLALALFICISSILEAEYLWLILGGWFLYQAIFNVSCCGNGSCEIKNGKKTEISNSNDNKQT